MIDPQELKEAWDRTHAFIAGFHDSPREDEEEDIIDETD